VRPQACHVDEMGPAFLLYCIQDYHVGWLMGVSVPILYLKFIYSHLFNTKIVAF
jgi:hypothetical protein